MGYETGTDRLLLWLPMIVTHVIDDDSPLSNWTDPETVLSDSDATIVVVVRSYSSLSLAEEPECISVACLWSTHVPAMSACTTPHFDSTQLNS